MPLETFPYDTADYLTDATAIASYLEVNLEEDESPYLARALGTVSRARGGFAQLSRETGIAADLLERSARAEDQLPRDVVRRVFDAFQAMAVRAKVA